MKKNATKLIALVIALMMAIGTLAGCTNSPVDKTTEAPTSSNDKTSTEAADSSSVEESTEGGYVVPEKPVVLRILHMGGKPEQWDAVYAKYLEMTKDILNIELDMVWFEWSDYKEKHNLEVTTGAEFDLCFDATWLNLNALASDGYYADLSKYFNNPEEYPGLAASFSEKAMENNKWSGSMCYIPLYEDLSKNRAVFYRQDWAREWGIGTDGLIESWEDMELYWDTVLEKKEGVVPLAVSKTGFKQLLSYNEVALPGSAAAGIKVVSAGGLNVWTYIKDNKLVSYAVEGSGDEAFKDFPEGWQYDFGVERYDKHQEWYEKGYIGVDSLGSGGAVFKAGTAGSELKFITDYVKYKGYEKGLGEGAEVNYFICEDAAREMKEGGMPTNYDAGNGLAVPSKSTKIDYTMKFLDWMFGSKEAHDLFRYGVEGVDYKYGEKEGTVVTLSDFSSVFYGFTFSMTPNYFYFSADLDDRTMDYYKYAAKESSYVEIPASAFKFDTSDVDLSTALAQCKAVTDMVNTVKYHGIPTDGDGNTFDTVSEMVQANVGKAMKNGGQEVVDAIVKQLTDFLANN